MISKFVLTMGMLTKATPVSYWPAGYSRWGTRYTFFHQNLEERVPIAERIYQRERRSNTAYVDMEAMHILTDTDWEPGEEAPTWINELWLYDRRGRRYSSYTPQSAWKGMLFNTNPTYPNTMPLPPCLSMRVQRETDCPAGRRFFIYHRALQMHWFFGLFRAETKYRNMLPYFNAPGELENQYSAYYPGCLAISNWSDFYGTTGTREVVLSCREKYWTVWNVTGYSLAGLNVTSRTFKI